MNGNEIEWTGANKKARRRQWPPSLPNAEELPRIVMGKKYDSITPITPMILLGKVKSKVEAKTKD
jgi:hypothetical protein